MTEKLKSGMQFFHHVTNWIMVLLYTLWRYNFTNRSTFTLFLINKWFTIENQTPPLYFICFSLSEFYVVVIFADSFYLNAVICEYVYNLLKQ